MEVLRYHVENVRAFLANHWAIRLLVLPVLFLASVIALFAVLSGNTAVTTMTVVGAYLVVAVAALVLGLLVEWVVRALTGGSLRGP